jgi:hypothetical protein
MLCIPTVTYKQITVKISLTCHEAKWRNRVELSVRETICGAERWVISSSNSAGLQVKLLNLTGVVMFLPPGSEGMGMNVFLVVISQTTYRIDFMLGVKRCFMYKLAHCVG